MIKKLFALPLVFLLMCGCAQNKTATPILNDISFSAKIDYGENEFVADITVTDDTLNLAVIEPQEINGLILNITKNGVTAEFKGISYAPDITSLPHGAVIKVLYNILNDISSGKTANCDNENCEITGKVDGYKYNFEFSPSGLPISLKVDELDLEIDFKNVTIN